MAHNLNFNEKSGKYSFFSVKEKAWHGLGLIVQDYPTSEQAIQYASLDYQVIKIPLATTGSQVIVSDTGELIDFNNILIPNQFGTVRTDTRTALGTVGKDYQIVQNREAFSFFDAIVGGGKGILYETAGALGLGERIFITAKLPDYIRVGNGDDITEQYIFLTTSHDGSGSITAAFTPIRVVCQNTLNAAFKNMTNVVRIKHTTNAKTRLEDAHKIMGIARTNGKKMEEVFNSWAVKRISDEEIKKLIQLALCPNKETYNKLKNGDMDEVSTMFKNTVESAFSYAMVADSQQMDTTKGTVFGAYNAITGYFQNVQDFKDDETKLKNIVLGGTSQGKVQKAFDLCVDYAQFGSGVLNMN